MTTSIASPDPRTVLTNALDLLLDMVCVVDAEGRYVAVNRACERLLGYTPQELLGRRMIELVHPDDRERTLVAARSVMAGQPLHNFENRYLHKHGHAVDVLWTARWSETDGLRLAVARDITERKQAEARLLFLAQHDPLTGLPNRTLFQDRLQMALARAHRRGERVALLYLDLDEFKPVNDRLGHAAGDELLRTMAQRIVACVRDADTVCRLGGDEFVVLLENVGAAGNADAVAAKIRGAVQTPCLLAGEAVRVSSSIGVALYPDDALEPQELLRRADTAMYAAKHAERAYG